MGTVIYCETKEATTPYIFTNTRIAVYSYEEVCYYIFHNPSMITMEHLGLDFTEWVREKIGMPELAEQLEGLLEGSVTLFDYLEVLLLAANYYSKNEVALLFERMKAEAALPKALRLKKQADGFLDFQKYVRAIRIYDTILSEEDIKEEFASTIYHNKGVALSRNFELEQAAECFKQAYEIYPNEVSLSCYFTTFFMLQKWDTAKEEAVRLGVDDAVYQRILRDYQRNEEGYENTDAYLELEKAAEETKYGQDKKAEKRIEKLIQGWKEDYRTQTT